MGDIDLLHPPRELEQRRHKLKRLVHRATGFVQDRYRLVFLDPVTGTATPTGPEGTGYVVELPKKW